MCAVSRQLSVPVSDLRYVRVGCQHCNTKVTVDLHEVSSFASGVVENCPGCNKQYDSSVPAAVSIFRDACKASSRILAGIEFVVSPPD